MAFSGGHSFPQPLVRTKAFTAETEAGEPLWRGVTERPDFTNPRGPPGDSLTPMSSTMLASCWRCGGRRRTVRDRCRASATCGTETFGGAQRTFSAHPKVDVQTGEMMVFDYKTNAALPELRRRR